MSDFVVTFDLLGGLTVDEWLKEMDRIEEEDFKKRRHTENKRNFLKKRFWEKKKKPNN